MDDEHLHCLAVVSELRRCAEPRGLNDISVTGLMELLREAADEIEHLRAMLEAYSRMHGRVIENETEKEGGRYMALEANAKRTEHNGAKNMSHDKPAKRADLKAAARKLRRAADKPRCRLASAYDEIMADDVREIVALKAEIEERDRLIAEWRKMVARLEAQLAFHEGRTKPKDRDIPWFTSKDIDRIEQLIRKATEQ